MKEKLSWLLGASSGFNLALLLTKFYRFEEAIIEILVVCIAIAGIAAFVTLEKGGT